MPEILLYIIVGDTTIQLLPIIVVLVITAHLHHHMMVPGLVKVRQATPLLYKEF